MAEIEAESGTDYVTNMKDTYGQNYITQIEIQSVVLDYLADNANVQ